MLTTCVFARNTKNDENRNDDTVSDNNSTGSAFLSVEEADNFHSIDEHKHPKVGEKHASGPPWKKRKLIEMMRRLLLYQ